MSIEYRKVLTLGVSDEWSQTLVTIRVIKVDNEEVTVDESNECNICSRHTGRCICEVAM